MFIIKSIYKSSLSMIFYGTSPPNLYVRGLRYQNTSSVSLEWNYNRGFELEPELAPELVSGAEITSFVPRNWFRRKLPSFVPRNWFRARKLPVLYPRIGFGRINCVLYTTKELVSRKLINAVLYQGIGCRQLIN